MSSSITKHLMLVTESGSPLQKNIFSIGNIPDMKLSYNTCAEGIWMGFDADMERMMKWFMERKMRRMSPKDKMEMMSKMMPVMLQNLGPEDLRRMMTSMIPEIMDRCLSCMSVSDVNRIMHEMMPKMMENCFSKMSSEQRKDMMRMWRTMLDKIEKKFLQQDRL